MLGWIGAMVVEYPFIERGQFATAYYFGFLMVVIPVSGVLEMLMFRGFAPKTVFSREEREWDGLE